MKKCFLLVLFGILSVAAIAQEFTETPTIAVDIEADGLEFMLAEEPYFRPSLSFLAPETFPYQLKLTEVNFYTVKEKKGVDLIAMMEQEKAYKEHIARSGIEFPSLHKEKEAVFTISNNVHLYNRGSNYDYYTGKIKNPAYREMRAGLFNAGYAPYNWSGQYRPYSFSPFLYSPSFR